MANEKKDKVVIKTYSVRTEAELALNSLKARGIDAEISAEDFGGMTPGFQIGSKGVALWVKREQADDARELLGDQE